ncbi:sugar nucleotide-binding protein [candidate division KSB3 bacterium]|uniref:dTDP-4-dehydrorhamnose reductase n=1 Tax=candidate division KSB3 bacterium TaxID=2044937 RepID=A0A9D5JXS4_9BACT|nr:sugar nucleotide-binding protein [candidate division KSB3 bacterium]MBD3326080.1 sugar nucleotide-binding protein [candidate division KSB3 bacterium]
MHGNGVSLVVGIDGTLGSRLAAALSRFQWPVLGTTRRKTTVTDHRLFLDLQDIPSAWEPPTTIDVAYLCAGITTLETCRRDPVTTAYLNVDCLCGLIQHLITHEAFIVYVSSNLVFDGTTPRNSADVPYSPTTEYGRQKVAVEKFLRSWDDSWAIVRLTKVLGAQSLLHDWAGMLKRQQPVSPFYDMTVSPVPLAAAISVLLFIGQGRMPGIWQVSGDGDISYAEAARIGARALGVDECLVQPIASTHSGENRELVPRYTSLKTERLHSELGLSIPPVAWTIHTAFTCPTRLNGTLARQQGER